GCAATGTTRHAHDRPRVTVPFINQYHPSGAGRAYSGKGKCGETVLAMIARAFGYPWTQTDAALIDRFAEQTGNTGKGSTNHGLNKILAELGYGHELKWGPHSDWVRGQLDGGHLVIASGCFGGGEP